MNSLYSKSAAVFSLAIATIFASNVNAQSYEHIDLLALRIQRQARALVTEARTHYRHTPEYGHLITDAREMARLAAHMHEVAHHHGSLAHLAQDLRLLDSSFHHLESVFDRVEIAASHGHGCIQGPTAHVKRLLNSIENNIHHLQEDIRILRSRRRCPHTGRLIYERPVYQVYGGHGLGHAPAPDYRHGHGHGHGHAHGRSPRRGRSFSIGGGSSRITFRF